jgi:hypothetical protein
MIEKPIYTVTCGHLRDRYRVRVIKVLADGSERRCWKDLEEPYEKKWVRRTFGYYHDFKHAESVVLDNATDIHEMNYSIACVETVYQGLYGGVGKGQRKQVFYLWMSNDTDEYDPSWNDNGYYKKIEGWPEDLLKHYEDLSLVKHVTDGME